MEGNGGQAVGCEQCREPLGMVNGTGVDEAPKVGDLLEFGRDPAGDLGVPLGQE